MKRLFTVLVLGGMMVAPLVATAKDKEAGEVSARKAAQSQVDNLDAMIAYLVSPQFIASRSELRRVDTSPVPELIVVATDAKKKPFVRERAIKCLSLFRDQQVKAAFSQMLEGKADRYFSHKAMAYLEAFGEDAVDDLERFLTDSDPQVRLVVVKGFGLFGGQKGFDLLVERDKVEENPQILAQIKNYIQ
jgi:hypothetical protein